MEWYLKVLTEKYADFEGRARRSEFWYFVLFNILASIVLSIIDGVLGTNGILGGIYSLGVLVPSVAVGARRLHDTGRSGWWQLIALIPLIGPIVLIVFCVQEGSFERNAYGPSPKKNPVA
ncbi:MAG: DUF805 domain-containing protein [Leptolyngbyaceae cyanobacterium MAG.088]|nr:DUF805 domain-containing protein [Leptolyngbyaceae cyanobacterium MAG.088]